ncbi:hypothetical protein F2Q68_00000785 [Brassica cretica]|uniref:Peptidase C1A papain C-terminal domain-containing protein n=1 Tax=Brassica cretica TaxID=69181 RepID=A0A8S9JE64_BRACR|nr:hypothetical protein F2Q68_00000785 [Brassica cretica]
MHNSWSIQLCDFKGQTHALNFHSGNGKFRTETGETTELLARSEMRQVVELPMHSVAVGAVEAAYHQKYGIGTDLSEQQLIDCSFRVYGNHGCFRGLPSRAFDYIKAYGLILERDYEYISLQSVCRQLVKKPFVNITRYVNITSICFKFVASARAEAVVDLPVPGVPVISMFGFWRLVPLFAPAILSLWNKVQIRRLSLNAKSKIRVFKDKSLRNVCAKYPTSSIAGQTLAHISSLHSGNGNVACRETGETTELLARSEMRQVVELPMHSVTVGAVEAAYHQKYGIGTDLSEQQLIDCSFRVYGNHGCFRGLPSRAFDYIKAYGLILERDYEYISLQSVCRQLEKLMVNTLQFNFCLPTPYVFMRRFLKAAQSDKKVHYKFELMEETLYLTINLIDMFLAVTQHVPRKKLQLVGEVNGEYIAIQLLYANSICVHEETVPLDLDTESFYLTRKETIESQLEKVANRMAEEMLIISYETHRGSSCRGVAWERFSLEELRGTVACVEECVSMRD